VVVQTLVAAVMAQLSVQNPLIFLVPKLVEIRRNFLEHGHPPKGFAVSAFVPS
jgi:hypothetical protein